MSPGSDLRSLLERVEAAALTDAAAAVADQLAQLVVLVTDGVQERNAASPDVAAALAASAARHPREMVHELGQAVLRATGGTLRDDASVRCLDRYGGPQRSRESDSGASSRHACR